MIQGTKKAYNRLAWYKKVLLVTTSTVIALSPIVVVPLSMAVEYGYTWLIRAVVAFESILGGITGTLEQLSFSYIGYIAALAIIPVTIGITAYVIDNKKPIKKGNKDGMQYEVTK